MKIMIEVSGGVVTNIVATQEVSIYLIDHDNLEEKGSAVDAEQAMQPYLVTYEEGHIAIPGGSETPIFDAALDEALDPYRVELDPSEGSDFHHGETGAIA
jgi:hypothetical protein